MDVKVDRSDRERYTQETRIHIAMVRVPRRALEQRRCCAAQEDHEEKDNLWRQPRHHDEVEIQ